MVDYFIMKNCENCKCEERFIQVKTWEGAMQLSKLLTKEANEFCFLCNVPAEYIPRKVGEKVLLLTTLEQLIHTFLEEQKGQLMLKTHKGRHINSLAIITKESEKEYDYYNKIFGNVATVFPKSENEPITIVVDTNNYPKEAIHVMTRDYTLDYIGWDYDQLEAPHWDAVFTFEEAESAISFLEDIWRFKQHYEQMGYERNLDKKLYYYSLDEKENYKGEIVRYIRIVEQDDWEHFHEFVYEHYHGASRPVQEIMKLLDASDIDDSSFYTLLSFKETKEVLENHPNFEYNEDFHQYLLQE